MHQLIYRSGAALLLVVTQAVHSGEAGNVVPPLQSVPSLDLQQYMGRWYQVALFPNRFQSQCVSDTTAEYALQIDGSVAVLNRCRTSQGTFDTADGVAAPAGAIEGGFLKPAQLKVSFLPDWLRWTGLGQGDYWVIRTGPGYRYAIVSEPERQYLWILSRTPQLSPTDQAEITMFLQSQAFDLSKLQQHPHASAK